MPIINVSMRAGRSTEDKRVLVASITEAVVKSLNCSPQVVTVILNDMAKENHAIGGVLDLDKK
jgi:4-oxalocrotonate tautomerase